MVFGPWTLFPRRPSTVPGWWSCTVTDRWTIKPANDRILEYSCEENNESLYDGSIVRWKVPKDEN